MKILGFGLIGLVVIILSGIGFVFYTDGAEAFSTKTVVIHEDLQFAGKDINSLEINSGPVDVKVESANTDSISIELNGEVSEKMKDAFELTTTEKNGNLNINLERKYRETFTVFAINKHTQLTVIVPEKMYEKVRLTTTSGDLSIQKMSSRELELAATSGDIHSKKLEGAASLAIESSSGDIQADELSFDEVTLKSTSGDIIAGKAAAVSSLSVESTSGDVEVETAADSFSLNIQTNSGDGEVTIPGILYEEKNEDRMIGKKGNNELSIQIKTTSGDYHLK